MGKLINHDKADEFFKKIEDPIVRGAIEWSYGKIFLDNIPSPEGDFDLLFFYRILEATLRDRKIFANFLLEQNTAPHWTAD